MSQPTAAGNRPRRLLSRCLVVIGGALAATAAAWLLSTGAASASADGFSLLDVPVLPGKLIVASPAKTDPPKDVAIGADVGAAAEAARQKVAGKSHDPVPRLSEAVSHADIVELIEGVERLDSVDYLTHGPADTLLMQVHPAVSLPKAPPAHPLPAVGGSEPPVAAEPSAGRDRVDPDSDHDCGHRPYLCRYQLQRSQDVSTQLPNVGMPAASGELVSHGTVPLSPVEPTHLPSAPVTPPACCSSGHCHGATTGRNVEQSAVINSCVRDVSAFRPTTLWAPLVHGGRPCTTPD